MDAFWVECQSDGSLKIAGSLPAALPAQFNESAPGAVSLSYIYLSNNSISGSLPATWGDSVNGWGPYLQGLYLDTNQLTGQLPLLWSESNSLSNLYRVDLFLNKMTGSVAWNPVNLPSLGNLVLQPGERDFPYGHPVVLSHVISSLSLPMRSTMLPESST